MSMLLAMGLIAASGTDWGAKLRRDATRFRLVVLDSHPGPVDPQNPSFRATLDKAHAQAMRRVARTRSYAGYSWALRELTATFDDGHLGIAPAPKPAGSSSPSLRWPGFATKYSAGRHRVTMSEVPAVPKGAVLVGCDGQDADMLAAERVGRFAGRWMLSATRANHGVYLFLPPDNPWLGTIARCTFDVGGVRRTAKLTWRTIDTAKREAMVDAAWRRHQAPIALEELTDGSYWIGMGSFDGDPASADGKTLTALNQSIAAQAAKLRRAPRVVFDLRGNNGGSSIWSRQAAEAIWGAAAVAARNPSSERVDWRVSEANLAMVVAYGKMFEGQRATNPAPYEWTVMARGGLERARAEGRALWAEPSEAAEPMSLGSTHAVPAKTFVLTDGGCGSACLDAVDVFTAMGAVQIGRETSADTLYMETRDEETPDGARIWLPMKVYRGRARGSNVPATPKHEWKGAIDDTAGIRRWLTRL